VRHEVANILHVSLKPCNAEVVLWRVVRAKRIAVHNDLQAISNVLTIIVKGRLSYSVNGNASTSANCTAKDDVEPGLIRGIVVRAKHCDEPLASLDLAQMNMLLP